MIRIGIVGCCGRMGHELLKEVNNQKKHITLSAAVDRVGDKIGTPINQVLGIDNATIITKSISQAFKQSDIIIEFSSEEGLLECAEESVRHNKPFVSGTTGLSIETKQKISAIAQKVPILWSPNTSFGINILFEMFRSFPALNNYDIDLVDIHHKNKKDSPSGTALLLGEAISDKQQANKKIQYHSLRCGGVFSKHSIIFTNNDEIITLSHETINKSCFARGAINAAKWLIHQKSGRLYTMRDMLNSVTKTLNEYET